MPEYPPLGRSLTPLNYEDFSDLQGELPNFSRMPFDFDAFAAAMASAPESTNVQDRRYMTSPLNPLTSNAFTVEPGIGMMTREAYQDFQKRTLDAIRSGARLPKR